MFERTSGRRPSPARLLNVRLKADEHEAVKAAALARGLSVSDLVRDALGAFLAQPAPPANGDTSTTRPSGDTP